MGFFTTICPSCGEKIKRSAKFCSKCRADSQSGWRLCDHWHPNRADAKFCSKCGRPIASEPKGGPVAQVWNRAPEDFARRFDLPDFQGAFREGFLVETGTRALLLADRKFIQELPAGRYTPESGSKHSVMWEKLPKQMTVILVDAGDTELYMAFKDLFAKDKVKAQVNARFIIRMNDPSAFFVNVLKDREEYGLKDLSDMLYAELKNAVQEGVSRHEAMALSGDMAIKKQFETMMEHHLSQTLGRTGLSLNQIRSLEFLTAEDALKEEQGRLETYKRRVAMWDELRKAANIDKMNKAGTEEELAAFIFEIDKNQLLRREEMEELILGFSERKEDRALARKFLVEKLTQEHNLEIQRVKMIEEGKMTLLQVDNEIEARRRKHRAELDMWEEGIRRKIKVALDALELKGKKYDLRHKRKMQEIDEAKELSKVSAEVLMTMTDTDKARMIADLTKTKLLAGLDEAKILAMGATDNPDSALAAAFAEKFKAMQDGKLAKEQKEMYEMFFQRLSDVQKDAMEKMRDVAKSAAEVGKPNVIYPPVGGK